MKRFLVLLMATALLLSVASVAAGEETTKIHFANYWSENEIAKGSAYFNESFTPETNLEIVFDYYPFESFTEKMISKIAAGDPSDLVLCNGDMLSAFVEKDLILPINDYLEEAGISFDHFYGIDEWTFDGKIMGLPSWYGAWYFYVNVDLFEEAGIEVPRGEWTFDQLREYAQKLTNPEKGIWGFVNEHSSSPKHWYPLNGGAPFSDDMSTCTINSPEVVNAMQFLADMIYVDKSTPESSLYASAPADQLFGDGQAAILFGGAWNTGIYRWEKDEINFEWDIIYPPTGPDADKPTTHARSSGMFIPKNAKNPDLSWQVMQFWSKAESLNALDIGALASMPASQECTDMEAYYTYPEELPKSLTKEFVTDLSTNWAKYLPYIHYKMDNNILNALNGLNAITSENRDAKTVCDEVYEEIMGNFDSIKKIG